MKIHILILLLIPTSLLFSQNEPEDHISRFFNEYETRGAIVALDNLYATNPWVSENQEAVDNVKAQLANVGGIVGKYYGYEFINRVDAGTCFSIYTYLIKYDRQPIRFTFQFYKPSDQWKIFSFAFDEGLTDEIEEAAQFSVEKKGDK